VLLLLQNFYCRRQRHVKDWLESVEKGSKSCCGSSRVFEFYRMLLVHFHVPLLAAYTKHVLEVCMSCVSG
jgi:hypothetical protein